MKNMFFIKAASLVLAVIMLVSLAACKSDEKENETVGGIVSPDTQENTDNGNKTQTEVAPATIEETVMWDGDDIKVTALSLTSDQYYHIFKLRIENKLANELYVSASRTAVNGFVTKPDMGVSVPANGTAECDLRIWLKDVSAKVIADIETRFSYSNSKQFINRDTERVKLKTSAAATFDYSYDESGTVLYDANGIKIISQGFDEDGDPIIYLSSTGELSEGLCVEELEVYVNGKKTHSDYCEWVFTGTRNLGKIDLEDEDTDGNELGEVESIKVSFKINKENVADRKPVKTELAEIPVK